MCMYFILFIDVQMLLNGNEESLAVQQNCKYDEQFGRIFPALQWLFIYP